MLKELKPLIYVGSIGLFAGYAYDGMRPMYWHQQWGRYVQEDAYPWKEFALVLGIGAIAIIVGLAIAFWVFERLFAAGHPLVAEVSHDVERWIDRRSKEDRSAYEQVAREIERDEIDKALWLKAFEAAGGNKDRQRAEYIK